LTRSHEFSAFKDSIVAGGRHGLLIEQSVAVHASPARVIAAFFDPADLAQWWQVARSVTLPRPLGPYAVQWAPTDFSDEVLGRLGGTLHGTVMDYKADTSFFLADAYWQPPDGDAIGPMALLVQAWPQEGPSTQLIVRQSAEDEGPRWQRYFLVMRGGWERALADLKRYVETGSKEPR
jgi:uncharacterized protein YndB with AHSA1/START domain